MFAPINLSKIRRILLVRTDRMGDVVVTTPVFSAIKKKYPQIKLGVLVSKENEDLVLGNPSVDEVISYDKNGSEKGWWQAYRFAHFLKSKQFDLAIHFHPKNRAYWTSYLAEFPIRIGYRLKNHWLLTHRFPYNKPEGKKHEAEYNFDLLGPIGVNQPERLEFFVPLRDECKEAVDRHLSHFGRYAVFNPSASSPSKIWPAAYFAHVADYLLDRYGLTPVVIGGKGDLRFSDAMKKQMQASAIDLTGKLKVGSLAWLFKKAEVLISNDTGPAHIAAALGVPVLSIFGRNLAGLGPTRWRPLGEKSRFIQKDVGCTACLADRCQIEFRCLKWLVPADVEAFIDREFSLLPNAIKH